MARKLLNIATGDIYKRLENEMHLFVNVKNKNEVVEMVQAEIINGELIRVDTYGMRYKKVC
jgi:hypothetical protein